MAWSLIRQLLEVPGDGWILVPFGFQINGTSDPDGLSGTLLSVVRNAAGKFTATLRPEVQVYSCIFGDAGISNTADSVDLYAKVDWSTVASGNTFVVRAMTAATQTDPTDNTLVGGFLLCKLNDRGP